MINATELPSKCIKYKNCEKNIVFLEKGREYCGLNPSAKEILGFKVDKGLIDDENERCDYSLIVQNDVCFLIELKGCDVAHASEQIMKTQEIFEKKYGVKKFVARIICSKAKTAELNSISYKRMDRFMKLLNKKYDIVYKPACTKTNKMMETI